MRSMSKLLVLAALSAGGCSPESATSDQHADADSDGAVTDTAFALRPGTGGGGGGGPAVTKTNSYVSYFSGDVTNVTPATKASVLLVGGGTDRDDAMQWFIDRSGKGDMVVLRATGSDGYNQWLLDKGANSVESIVFTAVAAASDPVVLAKVRNAEGLFFAGGDQSDYVKLWKDTPLETEINAAAARGIPIGGTSAGLAILGEFLYPALGKSLTSATALANPYHRDVMLDRNFLGLPRLAGVITDSHFVARDRMGRLLTFLARIITDGWAPSVRGIGVDEMVAIGIDESGVGRVFADTGKAYMLQSTSAPTACVAGSPLSFAGIAVYRLGAGATFDFNTWTGTGGTTYGLSVQAGVVSSTNGQTY